MAEDERNKIIEELKEVKGTVEPLLELKQKFEDAEMLLDLACEENDTAVIDEVAAEVGNIRDQLQAVTLKTTFTQEEDARNAFLSVQAGAGGTDACDWANMLFRMYLRYAERQNFKMEILDQQPEAEGGVKSATLHVQGKWAYGYLKSEKGVHRLIRISPYDASGKRHTSFAAVDVVPEFDDTIDADIDRKDIRIDFYRSSGAGGQHVNVTDSAVRITHYPTGLVVCCQNERSQHKNRAMAMKILQARVYQRRKEEQEENMFRLYGNKSSVSWSNQIRSYFLHPYTLIKDHRTDCETGNAYAVLDGDLQKFIEAYLLM